MKLLNFNCTALSYNGQRGEILNLVNISGFTFMFNSTINRPFSYSLVKFISDSVDKSREMRDLYIRLVENSGIFYINNTLSSHIGDINKIYKFKGDVQCG